MSDENKNKEFDLENEEFNDSEERDVDFSEIEGSEEKDELIQKLESDLKDSEDKYLRALADLENFKKRTIKERSELLKYQGERVFQDLLDIVDNLERALEHQESSYEDFKAGISMISEMFTSTLNKWEVKAESSEGQVFDPVKHNAISRVPDSRVEPGTVVSELTKTYYYKDRLLRPGDVVVADKPAESNEEE
ncbi:UNVERIFIED_CONTAM: hypothetical protein GTU68_020653 [Idotea baltica]|nr:hypothetical protein [Idotea baltica]